MTDLQIRELITQYQAAFNSLDADRVAAFYDEPAATRCWIGDRIGGPRIASVLAYSEMRAT